MRDKLRPFSNLKAKNSYLLAFIAIEILFIFSFPGNRTEADDGFWFASDVRDKSFSGLFNPRFPFYLPFARIFLAIVQSVGFDLDVYTFMCMISALFSGATILLFYHLLTKYFSFTIRWSLAAALLLLFSYEYWRYSVEAEVYMIAMFFLLLSLKCYLDLKEKFTLNNWVWLTIVSALAVLFYKPNFIPIYLCFPFLLLSKLKLSRLTAYYAVSGILILATYFLIYQLADVSSNSFVEYLTKGARQSPGSALMIPVVVASNFVSINWLFGFDRIQHLIAEKMPHKAIEEEVFMASGIGNEKFLTLALSGVLVITVLILVYFIIKNDFSEIKKRLKSVWFILLWGIIYGTFLAIYDPTSNEPWLMLQVPVIIVLLSLFNVAERRNYAIFTTVIFLVFLINMLGGIAPIKNKNLDFNYVRTIWLSNNSNKHDFILSYGPISLIRYLDYHTQATIINLEEKTEKAYKLIGNELPKESKLYVMDDFISPSKAIKIRARKKVQGMSEFMSLRHYNLKKVDSTDGFNTYVLNIGSKK